MAYYAPPPAPPPPALCAGSAFVDFVGGPGPDFFVAPNRAARVWGLGGDDRLGGSFTRASCLIAGRGNDIVFLNAGGGVALGQAGRDTIFGSNLGDVIRGGADIDGVNAGGGDDKIGMRDGHPELVDCGPGADQVTADRSDVLIGCESTSLRGHALPLLHARPAHASDISTVRVAFRPPHTARYRVLYLTTSDGHQCVGGPQTVLHRRFARGKRTVVLRRPEGGWCRGSAKLAIVRDAGPLPVVPVARISFSVTPLR